jgi:E3 ubiquitin-protein ligase UBR4
VRFYAFAGGKRRFMACPKDEKERCSFFAWFEDEEESQAHKIISIVGKNVAAIIRDVISIPRNDHGESLLNQLNAFVDAFVEREWAPTPRNKSRETADPCTDKMPTKLERDAADGVLCSRGRLRGDEYGLLAEPFVETSEISLFNSEYLLVQKSLEILTLTAVADSPDNIKWFPSLCKITMSNKDHGECLIGLRSIAKKALYHLCNRNTIVARNLRDQFHFGCLVMKLTNVGQNTLRQFIVLNEKARVCSHSWKSRSTMSFKTLSILNLIGTEKLLPEDVCSGDDAKIDKVLGELLSIAQKRKQNWLRFCRLPMIHPNMLIPGMENSNDSLSAPPLAIIFAMACSDALAIQTKALKLVNQALMRKGDEKLILSKQNSTSFQDSEGSVDEDRLLLSLPYFSTLEPEVTLKLTVEDLQAFVNRFVFRGITAEIRCTSSSIANMLSRTKEGAFVAQLLTRLIRDPLVHTGTYGKRSSDFNGFLHALVQLLEPRSFEVGAAASIIESCFQKQLVAIRLDRVNGEFMHFETRSSTVVHKKRFDLAHCVSCSYSSNYVERQSKRKATEPRAPKSRVFTEQVGPFSRSRLEIARESTASNDFNTFIALSNRLVLSDIHVNITDLRGRFVKTIKFYVSPRPTEPSVLKSQEFSMWQHCGTLTLPRGSTRASLQLPSPVVAASLRIEYASFYESPPATRSNDVNFIVHCPRCTRVITNTHGVCSGCGEVAFQCRRCRHINYERLDAFLCVECGFCASATFLYEITAAAASNAISITCDREYERSLQMLKFANRLHGHLRASLEKVLSQFSKGKKKSSIVELPEFTNNAKSSLQRAYEGRLSGRSREKDIDEEGKALLGKLGTAGSVVKLIAHPEGDRSTRSYFRTARQSCDTILVSGTDGESASEILGGLLERGARNVSDPLSRLLASVQRDRFPKDENVPAAFKLNSTKEILEECDRLYSLMREAEREVYELQQRCAAWRRLESGSLDESECYGEHQTEEFEPSHCSVCSATIATQLLSLWKQFFQLEPDVVEVHADFIKQLLNDDDQVPKSLREAKRSAVRDIAVLSKSSRQIVLEALRVRLIVLDDASSADILAQVIESLKNESDEVQPFLALAREAAEAKMM